jgi:ribosomal protein L23
MPQTVTYLPEMAITLVRRVTAKLPYNHFLFRVQPRHTKAEIREYLQKVYSVRVARISTSISLGAWRGTGVHRSRRQQDDSVRPTRARCTTHSTPRGTAG